MVTITITDTPKEQYGIYGNCVQQKGAPDILARSQESLDERFGLEDTENEPGYDGDGAIYPFREEN